MASKRSRTSCSDSVITSTPSKHQRTNEFVFSFVELPLLLPIPPSSPSSPSSPSPPLLPPTPILFPPAKYSKSLWAISGRLYIIKNILSHSILVSIEPYEINFQIEKEKLRKLYDSPKLKSCFRYLSHSDIDGLKLKNKKYNNLIIHTLSFPYKITNLETLSNFYNQIYEAYIPENIRLLGETHGYRKIRIPKELSLTVCVDAKERFYNIFYTMAEELFK